MLARGPFSIVRETKLAPVMGRLLRFGVVGCTSALVQLGLLALLLDAGWKGLPADILAFLVAAQVNFWFNDRFTWGDRRSCAASAHIYTRWARFHFSISGAALLNLGIFAAVRLAMPELPAAALGIAVAAAVNFLMGDRVVFRANRHA